MNRLPFAAALLAVASLCSAQRAQGSDLINLRTSIGSFKLISGEGIASFTFEGTVLLIDVKGDVKVEGKVKKEFDDPKLKRKAYFGKGKITVNGSWRGIQWFGSNMQGTVKGKSIIRLAGEFDKNLDTGEYWFGNDTQNKRPWYTAGITVVVPEDLRMNPQPTRRGGYGGG